MTVTNMSKAQPQIDFSLHKAPYKDLYDIQILFPDGTMALPAHISDG